MSRCPDGGTAQVRACQAPDQVRRIYAESRVKEGPIGKLSAPLVLERVHRQMKILVLNSGSSSQKACLYEIGDALPDSPPLPLWEGRIEWNGDTATITVRNSKGIARKKELKRLQVRWC